MPRPSSAPLQRLGLALAAAAALAVPRAARASTLDREELPWEVPEARLTLQADAAEPGAHSAADGAAIDPREALREYTSWRLGNGIFWTGLGAAILGGVAVGTASVLFVGGGLVWIITLGQAEVDGVMTAALYTAVGGVIAGGVSIPLLSSGGLIANHALRQEGIDATSIPGWVALGGLGISAVGAVTDTGELAVGGLLLGVAGGTWQVIANRKGLHHYEQERRGAVSLRVVPRLDRQAPGLAVVGAW